MCACMFIVYSLRFYVRVLHDTEPELPCTSAACSIWLAESKP